MSFSDLDNEVLSKFAQGSVVSRVSPPRSALQRWLARVDAWHLATAAFLLVALWPSQLVPAGVLDYAKQCVQFTVICEMYLFFVGFGTMVAWNKNVWLRVPIVALTVALYIFIVTHDRQFSIAPQAIAVMCMRWIPPRGVGLLSQRNVRRVQNTIFGGLAVLVVQIILLTSLSSLLLQFGIGTDVHGTITMPPWFYALLWSAYYVELAFVLPWIARNDGVEA